MKTQFYNGQYECEGHTVTFLVCEEDHSNLDVLDEDDYATEAEDTLTILTKHIESLNIEGDKKKLDVLMRSLYTESLDILV